MLVHGYRPGALDSIGLGEQERRRLRPGLVEVSLTAYGMTGPWSHRRGFDSLVQMSVGVAETGMRAAGASAPVPLPVQALDHATGWLMAAAAIEALRRRMLDRHGLTARLSLARTAVALEAVRNPAGDRRRGADDRGTEAPPSARIETPWGPADLLDPPLRMAASRFRFDTGPTPLGAHSPIWPDGGA